MQKRGDHTEMHFIRLTPCQQNHGVPAVMLPHVVASTSMWPHRCAVAPPPANMFPFGINLGVLDLFAQFNLFNILETNLAEYHLS